MWFSAQGSPRAGSHRLLAGIIFFQRYVVGSINLIGLSRYSVALGMILIVAEPLTLAQDNCSDHDYGLARGRKKLFRRVNICEFQCSTTLSAGVCPV